MRHHNRMLPYALGAACEHLQGVWRSGVASV